MENEIKPFMRIRLSIGDVAILRQVLAESAKRTDPKCPLLRDYYFTNTPNKKEVEELLSRICFKLDRLDI